MIKKNKVISLFKDTNVVDYSSLLNDFIKPFENDFPSDYSKDEIMGFSIHIWNFANLGKVMPPEKFQSLMQPTELPATEKELFKKMIALKSSKFEKYEKYILDFVLEEKNGELVLSVITGEVEGFLENVQKMFENQLESDDFEENYINRQAIILTPKQPFFDWINNLYSDDKVTDQKEASTYLVDDEIENLEKWLQNNFAKIFAMELFNWHTYKKEWPQKRNYIMFKQWFNINYAPMIYDLEKRPVIKE